MCEEDDPDFIAFRGDPSDKLPGAAGVGPKRAAQLVRRYGTLDGVLEAGLFQTQAEMLRLFRLIATMDALRRSSLTFSSTLS
jgi:DNA polymerase-1